MWDIDFNKLSKAKELGHCLCNLKQSCPCDTFIQEQECKCMIFTKVTKGKMPLNVIVKMSDFEEE